MWERCFHFTKATSTDITQGHTDAAGNGSTERRRKEKEKKKRKKKV